MDEEDEDLMEYDEEVGVIPDDVIAGFFIKDYITLNGPSSAWKIYRAWKIARRRQGKKGPSYQSFWRNYIWPLKKLGLLAESLPEPGEYPGTIPRKLLAISGDINHPAWYDPRAYLYQGETEHRRKPRKAEEIPEVSTMKELLEALERGKRKYAKTKKRGRRKKKRK